MATCEVCGNEYDKSFAVHIKGQKHTFDSPECAILAVASTSSHCSCRIIGHGVEVGTGCSVAHIAWLKRVRATP